MACRYWRKNMPRPRNISAALVLPVNRSSSVEPQTFPGFPGLWVPGVAVAVSDLGLTSDEAATLVREMGLPLVAGEAKSDEPELSEE
jgi:hypothetical protein